MQGNGYTSSYHVKGKSARWNNAITNKARVRITKNTEIEAKITYAAPLISKSIANTTYTVNGIDVTPPTIISLTYDEENNRIVGTVKEESEDETLSISGLPEAKYIISMSYFDFDVIGAGSKEWTSSNTLTNITESGKYYFYVKDNVGNVAMKAINVEAPDTSKPVIDSVTMKAVGDEVVINTIAHDNIGIVGYIVVPGDSDTIPSSNWTTIEPIQQLVFEYVASEDGEYTIWVKDESGLTDKRKIRVTTNKYPELDAEYPQDVRIAEGGTASFNIIIKKEGYPAIYDYTWQVSKDNGATWENVQGATYPTYVINEVPFNTNGNLYRCIVVNDRGSVTSRSAKMEVVKISTDRPTPEVTLDKESILGGIIINNGETSTTSNTVSIKVVGLHLAQIQIIEEGQTPTEWMTYQNIISYNLKNTESGRKTITVKAKDSRGTEITKTATAQIMKVAE